MFSLLRRVLAATSSARFAAVVLSLYCGVSGSACLFGVSDALAAVQEYGTEQQHYVLDVPEDWSAQARESGDGALSLVSRDGKSAISIRLCPREGRRIEALARRAATNLSVSSLRRQEENIWVLYVTSENMRVRNILQPMGEAVAVISVSGESEATQAILASLKPV